MHAASPQELTPLAGTALHADEALRLKPRPTLGHGHRVGEVLEGEDQQYCTSASRSKPPRPETLDSSTLHLTPLPHLRHGHRIGDVLEGEHQRLKGQGRLVAAGVVAALAAVAAAVGGRLGAADRCAVGGGKVERLGALAGALGNRGGQLAKLQVLLLGANWGCPGTGQSLRLKFRSIPGALESGPTVPHKPTNPPPAMAIAAERSPSPPSPPPPPPPSACRPGRSPSCPRSCG